MCMVQHPLLPKKADALREGKKKVAFTDLAPCCPHYKQYPAVAIIICTYVAQNLLSADSSVKHEPKLFSAASKLLKYEWIQSWFKVIFYSISYPAVC